MNVFVDTNVLMDVLLDRKPFVTDSQQVWFLAERGRLCAHVSVLSFPSVYYVLRKLSGAEQAARAMIMLRDVFTPAACDQQILNQAIDAGFQDFEDAIQYFSAMHVDAACIISRNPQHFPMSGIPVLTPRE
ncbi:MAG: PIN domain-containing protein, partial [Patescibacteria group bacterium]|nr:PIN domain-containing protein [Patescibacteria group bacterium]